jgi:putative oxidoreductase
MVTLDFSLLIVQLGVGLTFAAHGAQKIFGWWGGPGLDGWEGAMEHMGFRPARLFAITSGLIELVAGLLLAVGLLTPFVAAALVAQAVVIIGHVHWSNGFFTARSGFEFPLLLGLGAAAIGLAGGGAIAADALIGFAVEPSVRVLAILAGIGAGLAGLAVPRLGARRTAATTN